MTEDNFIPPGKDVFAELKGQNSINDQTYDDLKTILGVVNGADEPLAYEHVQLLAEEAGFDGSDNTFKKRVKLLFDWEPALLDWIVGQHPSAVSWVDVGARSEGIDVVECSTMNEVKRGCTEKGDVMKDAYAEASMREFQARALDSEVDIAGTTGGLSAVVDSVMNGVARICAEELPGRIESVNQATKSIAGDANEEIYKRCLQVVGHTNGSEYSDEGDDTDFVVFGDDSQLNAEVKSEKSRERASRSLMDEENPWILCSFFDDAQEVRNGMFDGNDQGTKWIKSSVAAYVPPSTLEAVRDLDESRDDGNKAYEYTTDSDLYGFDGCDDFADFLFLRSNEEFAADMQHYRQYGTLQDLDPGHEK